MEKWEVGNRCVTCVELQHAQSAISLARGPCVRVVPSHPRWRFRNHADVDHRTKSSSLSGPQHSHLSVDGHTSSFSRNLVTVFESITVELQGKIPHTKGSM